MKQEIFYRQFIFIFLYRVVPLIVLKYPSSLVDPDLAFPSTLCRYDVLADDYSAGLTAARITEIFDQVKEGLTPFLAELRERGTPPDASWLQGEFDADRQAALCRELAVALGFDLDKGRLDVSVHPFTGVCVLHSYFVFNLVSVFFLLLLLVRFWAGDEAVVHHQRWKQGRGVIQPCCAWSSSQVITHTLLLLTQQTCFSLQAVLTPQTYA